MAGFQKATKKQAKLRIALDGPAGTGKTWNSLEIAKVLGGRTAVIDTEFGTASLYADAFEFDTVQLEEFSLQTYLNTIEAAKQAGYTNLIIDSLSHAWNGKGGALQQVEKTPGASKFSSGWRIVSPLQDQLIQSIKAYPGHLIATMRTKTAYELVTNDQGKKEPKKIGMAPVQRDGMEYEFDFVCDLDTSGNVTLSKSRAGKAGLPSGLVFERTQFPAIIEKLKTWMEAGAPLKLADQFADEIRFAANRDVLIGLTPKFKAAKEAEQITPDEGAYLNQLFTSRLAEFES